MKRAAIIAALLAAAAGAAGRELPVQRDYVRPLEFGGESAEDLRAAPDVALAIERREEFAREMKGGGKKGFLARGERRASGGGAMYYGDASGDGEDARQKEKKDDWLVKSVTQETDGNSNTNRSAVESVLSDGTEEKRDSQWGWLAGELEQRQNEEADKKQAERDEEQTEGAYAEAAAETAETTATPGDGASETEAKRDEIRNAQSQDDPVVFAGVQKNLDDIREKLAVNTGGTSGTDPERTATPDAPGANAPRDWSQPILGNEPMKVTRIPESAGWDIRGGGTPGNAGLGMGFERPEGGGLFGGGRPTSGDFGILTPGGGGGVTRIEAPAWGGGGGSSRGGGWGAGGASDSGWAPLQIPNAEPAGGIGVDWNRGGTTTRPEPSPIRTGTMPW